MTNKLNIFLFVLLLSIPLHLFAEKISQQTAQLVAKNFYYESIAHSNVGYDQISILEFFDVKRDENSVYYAFNFHGGGFVIVSADDLFTPIIGYNHEGVYSETNVPENWQWLMNEFAEMIAFGQRNQIETNPKYSEMWNHLTCDEQSFSRGKRGVIVQPLCKAMWNQSFPYNYYAPEDPKGSGGRAYAGCVATAMSIIMHYWRWPIQGTGTHSYVPSSGSCSSNYPMQTANFGETEYHFDNMPNSITSPFDNSVALLMYHCGVAVDMMYCYSGSGAYSYDVPDAIINYFKYDHSATLYDKDWMSDEEWIDLLKTDLNKGYPIYNSGCSSSGCHAFVCDGYTDTDLFHYNFGWGGAANGYYTANNVNGFNSWQSVIVNFIPDMEQYEPECKEFTYLTYEEGTIVDCSGPTQNYKPNSSASWLIDADANGDMTRKVITIEWEQFDLAQDDYLRIYGGDSDEAPILAEYTKGSQPQLIDFLGSKMFIRFTASPDSETAKGFMLNYTATQDNYCNGSITLLTKLKGTFDDGSGENYNYSNSIICKWRIAPENAQSIHISFNYFETEKGKDILRITNLANNTTIASLSGIYSKDKLPSVTVPAGKVQIVFSTNNAINAKGFELNYVATLSEPDEIEQNQAVQTLTVYPNPASSQLNISFISPHTDPIKIELFNTLGEIIYQETFTGFLENYNKTIDVEMLSKGIYFLKIMSSNGISVKKIVIN